MPAHRTPLIYVAAAFSLAMTYAAWAQNAAGGAPSWPATPSAGSRYADAKPKGQVSHAIGTVFQNSRVDTPAPLLDADASHITRPNTRCSDMQSTTARLCRDQDAIMSALESQRKVNDDTQPDAVMKKLQMPRIPLLIDQTTYDWHTPPTNPGK